MDDSFEGDDCPSLAKDYALPGTGAQDRTLSGRDVDWVRVLASPNRIVQVSIGYATLPVQMQVFAPDGETLVAQGRDRLHFLASTDGPCLLRISARDGAPSPQRGHYRLVLEKAGEDDHPNEPASARELSVPATFNGLVQYYNDSDVAKLWLTSGHTYRIEVSGSTPSDVSVDVLAADGTTVRQVVRRFSDAREWTHFVHARTDEPVYLRARGTFGALTGPFSVNVADMGLDEHGDEIIDATPIAACATRGPACSFISGRWERPDDLDTFQFAAEARHVYRFTCRAGTLGCGAMLVGPDGRQVSPPGGTSKTRLETTATSAGTRFISVRPPSAGAATFEYMLEDVGVDDHPEQTLTPIVVGGEGQGEISTTDDVDSFSFQGARDRTYQVECALGSTTPPCRIRIVAGRSEYIGPSGGAGFLLKSDVLVQVHVEGSNGFTGAYHVSVTETVDEHGDTISTATPVNVGTSLQGAAQHTYDVDTFLLAVSAGKSYRVTCDSPKVLPELTVRNAEGREVVSKALPPPGGGAAVAEFEVNSPGSYTLAVRPYVGVLRYDTRYGAYTCTIVER